MAKAPYPWLDPNRDPPLCKDCRWLTGRAGHELCARPLSDRRSPVNGRPVDALLVHAERERRSQTTRLTFRRKCGPEGRFFEAVPTRPPPPPPPAPPPIIEKRGIEW